MFLAFIGDRVPKWTLFLCVCYYCSLMFFDVCLFSYRCPWIMFLFAVRLQVILFSYITSTKYITSYRVWANLLKHSGHTNASEITPVYEKSLLYFQLQTPKDKIKLLPSSFRIITFLFCSVWITCFWYNKLKWFWSVFKNLSHAVKFNQIFYGTCLALVFSKSTNI